MKNEEVPSWNEILTNAGRNIEDIGRMLRGKGRKKPKAWSIDDLIRLRLALITLAEVLAIVIKSMKEGNSLYD